MGGAGCLAGGCTCGVAVDPVVVTIVFVPLVLTPLPSVRKLDSRVFHFASVFFAQFLTQFQGSCRTVFHALSASYTVLLLYMGPVG